MSRVADRNDILDIAREQVLTDGVGLDRAQVRSALDVPDERLEELLALAHEVRNRGRGHRQSADRRLP